VEGTGSDAGRGFQAAYTYLNRRVRTVAEVRSRLEKAEIPPDEIEVVLAELLEFGYLDDARYARVFTQDKRALDAWGNERIARVLRERGVDRELVEAALAELSEVASPDVVGGAVDGADGRDWDDAADGEFARAVALLLRRFPAGPAEQRDRERAFGMLARKGYESETAADAVREWVRRAAA
jgi:regulatory protein